MDKRKIIYLVDYDNINIERLTGHLAETAEKIHPERCFEKALVAKMSLVNFYRAKRDEAQANLMRCHLVTWSNIKPPQN